MRDLDTLARRLADAAPPVLDLADGDHLAAVTAGADALIGSEADRAALDDLESRLIEAADTPLAVHPKRLVLDRAGPLHVSVVFAVYLEHRRILTRAEHPHGEDFMRRKVDQLRWLLDDRPGASFDLVVVDDGCPEGSGRLVQAVLDDLPVPVDARVLFLEEAIRAEHPTATRLASAGGSRKGGSIHLGLWEAAGCAPGIDHVVVFTDADLSTHLGQVGLLVDGVLGESADAAVGSRRESTSVVVKQGVRNLRGKLFIYLWKRLLPDLADIVDTQCGFKAWRADVVRDVIGDAIEKGFAFDIEMLLRTETRRPGSVRKVPVAWIDSEAASTRRGGPVSSSGSRRPSPSASPPSSAPSPG
jgi:hypothetical protein